MKICRFDHNRLGVIENDMLFDVSEALSLLSPKSWPIAPGDPLIAALPELRERVEQLKPSVKSVKLSDIHTMLPVTDPSKIIGAPVNYRSHMTESEQDATIRHGHNIKPISEWGLFLKARTAMAAPRDGVVRRFPKERTDHELELCVIIGRGGNNISAADALSHVAGYTVGLDITLRGPQFQSFRKSIDSYAMFGPWLVTADEIDDPSRLDLSLWVNGELRQQSNTRHLIMGIPELIEFASSFYTLCPGDIIMTGTPDGVGPIVPGDIIKAEISTIGGFETTVRDA